MVLSTLTNFGGALAAGATGSIVRAVAEGTGIALNQLSYTPQPSHVGKGGEEQWRGQGRRGYGWGATLKHMTCLLSLPVGFQDAVEFEVFKPVPFPDMLLSAALVRHPQFQHDTTRWRVATHMACVDSVKSHDPKPELQNRSTGFRAKSPIPIWFPNPVAKLCLMPFGHVHEADCSHKRPLWLEGNGKGDSLALVKVLLMR
jgi:hypothetical protein